MLGRAADIEKADENNNNFRTVLFTDTDTDTDTQLTVMRLGPGDSIRLEAAPHPRGAIHGTKADAEAADAEHEHPHPGN